MKPNRKSLFLTIALAMVLSLATAWPCAAAVPDPTPTDLGVLPIYGHKYSEAYAINANGQVVGESYEADTPYPKPFIWQNGVMAQLPLPVGFYQGVAKSINDAGQVVGYCKDWDSQYQAFLWTYGAGGWVGTALGAPTVSGPEDSQQEITFINSKAFSINNDGQIFVMASGIAYEGETYDISVGAIWQDGTWSFLTDSDGLTRGASGFLSKINDNGQVLFTNDNSNEVDHDLYVWDGETASKLVERIDWANLNNVGQIVGRYYDSDDKQSKNFTYDTETKILNFSPASDAGYHLVTINDKGQVLVLYPTNELGITSFEDWSPGSASVTSLCFVDGSVEPRSLNFNANGEVSGHCYTSDTGEKKLFYASEEARVIPLDGFVQDGFYLDVMAMNDSGVIIGRAQVEDGGAHAVLWGVPPVSIDIFIDPSSPVPVNTQITSGAFLSDLQTADTQTAAWNWGDRNSSEGIINMDNRMVIGEHIYAEPGVYSVTLEIFNSEEELLNQAVYQYVVVYDPTAGFVTGGGWFDSPAGAYKDDLSLEGKATFGFVSRYKKGATIPTGNTVFEFQTGDLYFHSTSYEWLVVTGSDYAKFKGSGTINGGGDFKFMVWAGDDAPDTFRIKIWDELEDTGEEEVIYDNGFDQAINGGSIVIHTK